MKDPMKLTKAQCELIRKYPLYSQDGAGDNAKVLFKIFMCGTGWSWYVTEANPIPAEISPSGRFDYECFGLVVNQTGYELGYFMYNEIADIKLQNGLVHAEIDKYYTDGKTIGEVKKTLEARGII